MRRVKPPSTELPVVRLKFVKILMTTIVSKDLRTPCAIEVLFKIRTFLMPFFLRAYCVISFTAFIPV